MSEFVQEQQPEPRVLPPRMTERVQALTELRRDETTTEEPRVPTTFVERLAVIAPDHETRRIRANGIHAASQRRVTSPKLQYHGCGAAPARGGAKTSTERRSTHRYVSVPCRYQYTVNQIHQWSPELHVYKMATWS